MSNTPNLNLPLLSTNQSGKEVTHNEALVTIDAILNNGVIDKDLTTPPGSPNDGDIYIVGSGATGDWASEDNNIASYNNGWRFLTPKEGLTLWINDENVLYTYNGSSWGETISENLALDSLSDVSTSSASQNDILVHNGTNFINTKTVQNLNLVGINTTADTNNKLAVASDNILFQYATDDIRVKANKASSSDTASHLFQDNTSGRAEFGLIGDDDFTLKVSADGSSWNDSYVVDKDTGDIDFKGKITADSIAVNNIGKNYLINGNFDIWQRGSSFSSLSDGDYTADRWKTTFDETGGTRSIDRQSFTAGQTDVPNDPKYYLEWQNTSAGSGGTYKRIEQRIEDVSSLSNGNATISFYAKADSSRTLSVDTIQNFGSGGSTEVSVTAQNINVTSSWQKFTLTFAIPSINGKTVGTSSYISFRINLPLNTTFTFDLSQVQVEKGSVANNFEVINTAKETLGCKRYYQYYGSSSTGPVLGRYFNFSASARDIVQTFLLNVPMRTAPTVSSEGDLSDGSTIDLNIFSTDENYCAVRGYSVAASGFMDIHNLECDAEL